MKYAELYESAKTPGEALDRLDKILVVLRGEDGCPWDREQTHESIRGCMLEEAYEVVDAIQEKNWDNLEEELGDVALQVVFHSGLASESGKFDLTSVINRECEKMISRHPHVFNENQAFFENNSLETVDKVLEKWENIKRKEKSGTQTDSMLQIPKALPALLRSYKVQKKAAQVGFDWDDVSGAFDKIKEETGELLESYRTGTQDDIKEELGDLLFAVVNVARFLHVDPEEALNFTSEKFIRRFHYIEETSAQQGRRLEEMSLEEMDKLWDAAKSKE
ncbi:MAG: nucleoside triphosphate pyrophosphohydrolase [Clostridiales bacterium]|nr:nucleoside triphosphate pyrophosphohydrolase [Clostridiales bacterium]